MASVRAPARAQVRLHLAEGVFDRAEVGRVRRQEEQAAAARLDQGPRRRGLVDGEVVEDDDLAGAEGRGQEFAHVGDEGRTVERPGEGHRRANAPGGERGDQRDVVAVVARHRPVDPLAARGAGVARRHRDIAGRLVEEDEVGGRRAARRPRARPPASPRPARRRSATFFARDPGAPERPIERPDRQRRALLGLPPRAVLRQRVVGVRGDLRRQRRVLRRGDLRRPARRPARRQAPRRPSPLEVALDRRHRDLEEACGLGARHPRVDRIHDPLAEVCRVRFHRTSVPPGATFPPTALRIATRCPGR